jgi:hypothetical protein
MQKITKILAFVLISGGMLVSCGEKKDSTDTPKQDTAAKIESKDTPQEPKQEEKKEASKPSEDDIKAFLYSKEGTFGWRIDAGTLILLDFFKDGRLSVQGPDGEATMWEGKWSLAGDQLTMECKGCGEMKAKETVTVKMDGEKLVLGDKTYSRNKPQ